MSESIASRKGRTTDVRMFQPIQEADEKQARVTALSRSWTAPSVSGPACIRNCSVQLVSFCHAKHRHHIHRVCAAVADDTDEGQRGWIVLSAVADGTVCLHDVQLPAQERTLLRVLAADRLTGSEIGDMEIRELIGNVRLRQDNVYITCDRATQNLTRNSAQLSGNVVITQDTLTMKTPRGNYDGQTRTATSREGVYLNDGHVTLQARIGNYRPDPVLRNSHRR
jgi:hypothetical protein